MPAILSRARVAGSAVLNDFDVGMTYDDYVLVPGTDYDAGGGDSASMLTAMWARVGGGTDTTHHKRYRFPVGVQINHATLPGMPTGFAHVTLELGGAEGSSYTDALGNAVGQTGGCHIHNTSTTFTQGYSVLGWVSGLATPPTDIRIHGGKFSGGQGNSSFATSTAGQGGETQFGVSCYGGGPLLLDHMEIMEVKGDCVYASDRTGSSTSATWSTGIEMRYSVGRRNGRQGVAAVATKLINIHHNAFEDIAEGVFDIEPNNANGGCQGADFNYNRITGKWSWETGFDDAVFVAVSDYAAVISGTINVLGNKIDGQSAVVSDQWTGFAHLWDPGNALVKTAATLNIQDNVCSISVGATHVVSLAMWTLGATITNNTGFAPSGGRSWVSDLGSNGTITQSGNT